jgi:hypothetical protein
MPPVTRANGGLAALLAIFAMAIQLVFAAPIAMRMAGSGPGPLFPEAARCGAPAQNHGDTARKAPGHTAPGPSHARCLFCAGNAVASAGPLAMAVPLPNPAFERIGTKLAATPPVPGRRFEPYTSRAPPRLA